MTENKRFTLTNPKNAFQEMKCGIDDRSNTLTFNEVVALLNSLNEENEQLEQENKVLQSKLQMFMNVVEEDTKIIEKCNKLLKENEQLKQELKRCRDWINSDKDDYELTLSFIKNKGYSLKDVLEYERS